MRFANTTLNPKIDGSAHRFLCVSVPPWKAFRKEVNDFSLAEFFGVLK